MKKFAFDIWGDTVNNRSKNGAKIAEPGRINISQSTLKLVKGQVFNCTYGGRDRS